MVVEFGSPLLAMLLLMLVLMLDRQTNGFGSKKDLIILGGEEGCPPKLVLKSGGKFGEDILLMPTCHKKNPTAKLKVVKHIHVYKKSRRKAYYDEPYDFDGGPRHQLFGNDEEEEE